MNCWSRKCFVVLPVLFILLFAGGAAAESFVVYQPATEGYDTATAKVVGQLLASELEMKGGGKAAYVSGDQACVDETCARAALQQNLADAAIIGKLMKLGDKAILLLTVLRKDATTPYRVTATGIGEFDRLMPRLAEAIVARKSFEDAQTVSSVSAKEQETYKRVEGDFSWGPGLFTLVPVGGSYVGNRLLMGVLLDFRYEIARWGFEFETGCYFDDQSDEYHHAGEFPLDLSGMYFFSEGIGSFLAGGSVGLHYLSVQHKLTPEEKEQNDRDVWNGRVKASASGDNDYLVDRKTDEEYGQWGPSVAVFGGYEFLRTHTFHIDARAGYRFTFINLDDNFAHGPFAVVHFTFGHNK